MRAGDLRVVKGPDAGAVIEVATVIVLGRDVEGPGQLTDPTVSSRHARLIRRNDGQLLIEDLGSRNGTLVNGGSVQGSLLLNVGDLIQMGNSQLQLEPDRRDPTPAAGAASGAAGGVGTETGPIPIPPPPGARTPSARAPVAAAYGPPAYGPPAYGPPGGPGTPGGPVPPPLPGRGGPPPGAGSRSASSRGDRRAVALVCVVVLIIAAFGAGWFVRTRTSSSTTSSTTSLPTGVTTPGAGNPVGTVYIESNDSTADSNAVLAYSFGTGATLQPLRIAAYPTGGSGSADLADRGVLDATGHLTVDTDRHLLFAVNQGSDTVAVFHVAGDGALTPVAGSPFPSGGKAPVSIGVNGNLVVVVNKAQDGIRDLSAVSPNYTTFTLNADGSLTPTGHTVSEPPGSSPTQALITPDGHLVFGSEESGPFQVFLLGADGSLTPGPGSGLTPPGSLFPSNIPLDHQFGLGMSINPTAQILYAQLANANDLGVYSYQSNGQLTFIRAVHNKGGEEPCWSELSADGTRLYVDDAANNTTSVYDTSNPRDPKVLQNYQLLDNGNPWDLSFGPTGKYLFVVAPRAREVNVTPGQGNQLHVEAIGADGKLSEPDAPVAVPVPLNTNPFGVAVIADS